MGVGGNSHAATEALFAAMQLTTNLSNALIDLIRSGEAPIDAIEIGPWLSAREIQSYERQLSGWVFHFHAGSLISRVRWIPGSMRRLNRYLSCTESLWVSVHMESLPWHLFWLGSRFGLYVTRPGSREQTTRFAQDIGQLSRRVELPVILENLPSLPADKFAFVADPICVTEVLESTNCSFLLDIAHARVAAANQGREILEYLCQLPLERVVQIHVSGPRPRNGFLCDAHEPLQEADYAILEWVLERTSPQVVTLEYFRERGLLREQLVRLRKTLVA